MSKWYVNNKSSDIFYISPYDSGDNLSFESEHVDIGSLSEGAIESLSLSEDGKIFILQTS